MAFTGERRSENPAARCRAAAPPYASWGNPVPSATIITPVAVTASSVTSGGATIQPTAPQQGVITQSAAPQQGVTIQSAAPQQGVITQPAASQQGVTIQPTSAAPPTSLAASFASTNIPSKATVNVFINDVKSTAITAGNQRLADSVDSIINCPVTLNALISTVTAVVRAAPETIPLVTSSIETAVTNSLDITALFVFGAIGLVLLLVCIVLGANGLVTWAGVTVMLAVGLSVLYILSVGMREMLRGYLRDSVNTLVTSLKTRWIPQLSNIIIDAILAYIVALSQSRVMCS